MPWLGLVPSVLLSASLNVSVGAPPQIQSAEARNSSSLVVEPEGRGVEPGPALHLGEALDLHVRMRLHARHDPGVFLRGQITLRLDDPPMLVHREVVPAESSPGLVPGPQVDLQLLLLPGQLPTPPELVVHRTTNELQVLARGLQGAQVHRLRSRLHRLRRWHRLHRLHRLTMGTTVQRHVQDKETEVAQETEAETEKGSRRGRTTAAARASSIDLLGRAAESKQL